MNFWKEPLKIGNLSFPRFVGGPMDGITDSPFRTLIREFSPDALLYTEIAHASAVIHASHKTNIFRFESEERPLNFQITTNNVNYVEPACLKLQQSDIDMVDLNIGCPARNVVGSGSGSALMGDIPRLKEIVRSLRSNLKVPLTVKMRAGFKVKNALEVARLVEDEGVDAIVIHPRLQPKKFSGPADYSIVAHIKREISIPVIISGNVVDAESVHSIYKKTGVDGFMVSRALRGAPWKLKELSETVQGHSFRLSAAEICTMALKHFDVMLDYYGLAGLYMFRKHLAYYLKSRPDASDFRSRLMVEESVDEVKEGIKAFFGACSD